MLSNLRDKLRKLYVVNDAQKFEGTSRRATSYFPTNGCSPDSRAKLAFSSEHPILPQLIKIEAGKLSGCIKMESKRYKSRSAALIYNGRVIACVYGSKARPEQVFGAEAYSLMMSEIRPVYSEVTSYILDEEVVLSAASMFHGEVFNATPDQDPKLSLSGCMKFIEDLGVPGSVAVTDHGGKPVCLLYLSGSSLLGINSLNSSVKEKNIRSLWQYLEKNPRSRVMANYINLENDSISRLTFSVLGKSDQYAASQHVQSRTGVYSVSELTAVINTANLVSAYSVRPTDGAAKVRSDRFISQRDLSAKQMKVGTNLQSCLQANI